MLFKVSLETQGNQITVRLHEVKQARKNKKRLPTVYNGINIPQRKNGRIGRKDYPNKAKPS